jgi:hypothetical protein
LLADEVVGELDPEQREIVHILSTNSRKLEALIAELINYSQANARPSAQGREKVEVARLVDETIEDNQLRLRSKSVAVARTLRPVRVLGNPERLRTIVDNLLPGQAAARPARNEGAGRGATDDEPVDVRIISATHADLDKALVEGNFREDLYYRLAVVTLFLPALAKRPEDIPLPATSFLHELAESYGERVKGFSPEALEALVNFEWPGNVRQLRNVVEQCVALSTTPLIPVTLVQRALREEPASFLSL